MALMTFIRKAWNMLRNHICRLLRLLPYVHCGPVGHFFGVAAPIRLPTFRNEINKMHALGSRWLVFNHLELQQAVR